MIRAILEAGIPIDRVAGVSIGAFMGGLWCQERDIARMTVKARNFCTKMSQKWRMAIDLTYPYCSMMTGFGFNGLIEETFPETCIEDLWLPYFTITTDISESKMKVRLIVPDWWQMSMFLLRYHTNASGARVREFVAVRESIYVSCWIHASSL